MRGFEKSLLLNSASAADLKNLTHFNAITAKFVDLFQLSYGHAEFLCDVTQAIAATDAVDAVIHVGRGRGFAVVGCDGLLRQVAPAAGKQLTDKAE